jgi:hypothetical protein
MKALVVKMASCVTEQSVFIVNSQSVANIIVKALYNTRHDEELTRN